MVQHRFVFKNDDMDTFAVNVKKNMLIVSRKDLGSWTSEKRYF